MNIGSNVEETLRSPQSNSDPAFLSLEQAEEAMSELKRRYSVDFAALTARVEKLEAVVGQLQLLFLQQHNNEFKWLAMT